MVYSYSHINMGNEKKKKLGLLPKLIIAIVLGIVVGNIAKAVNLPIIIELGATYNSIFGNFISFCIPLIIIGFVVPGIADLGEGAGKTLAITALVVGSIVLDNAANAEETMLSGLFTIEMPPVMGVMTALLMAFILGLGISITQSNNLKTVFHEFANIVEKLVGSIIIPLLPIHVYGIFANMTYTGTVVEIMSVFINVFALIIVMHIIIILFQYFIAGTCNSYRYTVISCNNPRNS